LRLFKGLIRDTSIDISAAKNPDLDYLRLIEALQKEIDDLSTLNRDVLTQQFTIFK